MNQQIDTSGSNRQVASWIWRNLVPESGQANSVQGELMRAVEKLRREAQENGNINWDDGFLMLLDFLDCHLVGCSSFNDLERKTMQSDLVCLRDFLPAHELDDETDSGSLVYIEDDLYDRLENFVVSFVRANPQVLPHAKNLLLHR